MPLTAIDRSRHAEGRVFRVIMGAFISTVQLPRRDLEMTFR
jgi:hypothetical protein